MIINNQESDSSPQEHPPAPDFDLGKEENKKQKKSFFKYFSLVTLIIINLSFMGFAGWKILGPQRLISPLGKVGSILGFKDLVEADKPSRMVMGYLPYWNFKYIDKTDFSHITHLAIFGIAYEADGSIQTREANYMEPGYRNVTSTLAQDLQKKLQAQDTKVILTVTSFDNEIIESIVLDTEAQNRLVQETFEFVTEAGYDGINIDFEYVGVPEKEVQDGFTQLVSKLTSAFKESDPEFHVSVAVYADSTEDNRIWLLEEIGPIVDQIMIMAYDFYRQSSDTAGPVAPLYGGEDYWRTDITTLLEKHLEINPPEKLILGVPFYGYEWRTQDEEFMSPSIGSGWLASYDRVQEILDNPEVTPSAHFNEASLTPWISYQVEETERFYQIHYDDTKSLGLKYDFVNQLDLAGIGIWAIGYEGEHPELWDLIDEKF